LIQSNLKKVGLKWLAFLAFQQLHLFLHLGLLTQQRAEELQQHREQRSLLDLAQEQWKMLATVDLVS
jgi:hypothetical protein